MIHDRLSTLAPRRASVLRSARAASRGLVATVILAAASAFAVPPAYAADDLADKTNTGPSFTVTPTGSSRGDGSAAHPWDLATALAQPRAVVPGSTIWLRAGTYTGAFTSSLVGTAAAPIVVRAWPGERAVVDLDTGASHAGRFTIQGSYAWFWGLEVTDSHAVRSTLQTGSDPSDVPRENASVYALGDHLKFINMTVHDLGDGFCLWTCSLESEIYGCLTFDNGWNAPDRGHGHGIYTQNESGEKLITDVISFNNFETGMKAYGVNGSVRDYAFDGVVSFNNGSPTAILRHDPTYRGYNLFVGSEARPADTISVSDCDLYYPIDTQTANLRLGYTYPDSVDVTATGCTITRGHNVLYTRDWRSLTFTNNTLWLSGSPLASPKLVSVEVPAGSSVTRYAIDRNTYLDSTAATNKSFQLVNGPNYQSLTFATWKSTTGQDAHSTYTKTRPTGTHVVVRPNDYEPGRANVVVYNWSGAATAQVDLGDTGLVPGQRFEIHDVQNLFGAPVLSGTYTGAPVTVSLAARTVAPPIGMSAPAHTGPEFFVFLVTPVS